MMKSKVVDILKPYGYMNADSGLVIREKSKEILTTRWPLIFTIREKLILKGLKDWKIKGVKKL